MLFNSYIFLFLFLPIVLIVFYWIGNQGSARAAIAWLVGASIFFYGWWNPAYLKLIFLSILFNYAVGVFLGKTHANYKKKLILIFGIIANLGLLGFFKYANFFIDNFNVITENSVVLQTIILPLAISFFTFQQITYLVDMYKEGVREYSFLQYCLFVLFFPQLIAGPIVHHKEMLPQFLRKSTYKLSTKHLIIGFTIFVIGLFKKVILADGIAIYSTPVFNSSDSGIILTFFESWSGALSYSLQLYFDFSGYSDMAIGIARMFGIFLPLNFYSPYKSTSIIDFWSRWHITLSRFLRDYLYIPLGGNRKGKSRRLLNLMITMLLGGLWHGAGWTFVLWGGLHGLFLIINHLWRSVIHYQINNSITGKIFSWTLTMLVVVIAWVPFRSESIEGAINMLSSMFGLNGISLQKSLIGKFGIAEEWLIEYGLVFNGVFSNEIPGINQVTGLAWIIFLFVIVVFFPNTQQLMGRYHNIINFDKKNSFFVERSWIEWRPTKFWMLFTVSIFIISIIFLVRISEFLYFQF